MVGAQPRMDPLSLFIYSCAIVVIPCCGFTLDTEQPIIFQEAVDSFGQSVVHFGAGADAGVLVSAPLQKGDVNETGKLYKCQQKTTKASRCEEVTVQKPPDAINMSLGMSLSASNSELLACGPTVHQTCGNNIYLKGYCFLLDQALRQTARFPENLPECAKRSTDIALLIDGSGSIKIRQFSQMKTFISEVMKRFQNTDTQFALSQYSHSYREEFDFRLFKRTLDPDDLVRPIAQLYGETHTATYIQKVVREIFLPEKGARPEASKILIVITDGEKSGDWLEYSEVIPEAEQAGIIRFAIGVGKSFSHGSARQELDTIASAPVSEHVFPVDNFDALADIQNQLQDKIFAIEGTQAQSASSFQLEMSQEGFSALVSPDGSMLGAVGANDWSGGAFLYPSQGDPTFINVSSYSKEMHDAYLGYSMQTVRVKGQNNYVVGAPRYQHIGRVFMFSKQNQEWKLKSELSLKQLPQIGSYFGATLCSVDLDGDTNTDLILIGAPMYYDGVAGGRVYICQRQGDAFSCNKELKGEAKQPLGRFGASMAQIGDVTGDRWTDVAIGAPMENENQGAVYLFRGTSRSLKEAYSQRIHSLPTPNRLQYFGQAISAGMDLTDDGLPDVAVGAQGKVLLLKSRPVIGILPKITFTPSVIPISAFECRDQNELNKDISTANVCFTVQADPRFKQGSSILNTIKYTLTLDPGRLKVRAAFNEGAGSSVITNEIQMGLTTECKKYRIKLPTCIEDSITPIVLRLSYTLKGDPIVHANNLKAILNEDDPQQFTASLPFEKNCGTDGVCRDELKTSFNFSGLNTLVVGMTTELNLTVFIRNDGEDSFSTTLTFSYPSALSYRRARVLQSNRKFVVITCASIPAAEEDPQRSTTCNINHPIFRSGAQVTFVATFSISQDADFGSLVQINATADSENNVPTTQDMIHQEKLPVRYAVYIFVNSLDESTKYVNFSSEHKDGNQTVEHQYEVKNTYSRKVPVSVRFHIPVRLNGTLVWDASVSHPSELNPLVNCNLEKVSPESKDFVNQLRQSPTLDCSVAACKIFHCYIPLLELRKPLMFTIKGNLSFKWVAQTQQKKVTLVSRAQISYDEKKYTQKEGLVQSQAQTVVEHLVPYNYLPVIIGSTVGGLILLAVAVGVLYKVGFFNRQYKQRMDVAGSGGAEGAEPPPPSTSDTEAIAAKV